MSQPILISQIMENPDLLVIGIGIVLVLSLLIGLWRAFWFGISGAIIGAFIGPLFLEVSVEDGMMAGGLVFALIGFFSTGE